MRAAFNRVGLIFVSFLATGFALINGVRPTDAQASDRTNPLFGYTHILPSPFTLPAGALVYGTDLAIGITDRIQIGTGILRDLYGYYNANLKFALIDTNPYALALTFEWLSVEPEFISPGGAITLGERYNSYLPGLTQGIGLAPELALFLGGQLRYSDQEVTGTRSSSYLRGALAGADISWAYAGNIRKLGISNVLSIGASYDVTYSLWGFGLSHHWPSLTLGLHCYPKADRDRFLPIISGGGTMRL